ncbi:hypothetical protein BBK82_04955 [Lentzea guizhouensis]|uniref:Uncharacterized protein n=1 Tax=Lentzea guizhouensis TaxID=1586287 RepID=A0A1B2HCT0_9PSEU|nr:hypothetical protein BBK82_04955 [Lentzea guizhouensis]
MAQTNRPTNVLDRIKHIEAELKRLRSSIGLSSATITRGGLTLLNDAFLRMVDTDETEIVYIGPDSQGRQIIRIRREGGGDVMWTGFSVAGNQFWRLTDRFNREIISDDTEVGGIARPWLAIPLYPKFTMAASAVHSYMNLPVASVVTETTLWEGRIPMVTHPYMVVSGIFGQATGSNTSTYRLKVNGTTVGTWAETSVVNVNRGPFYVAASLSQSNVPVTITAEATGSGNIGCQVYSLYQRQT